MALKQFLEVLPSDNSLHILSYLKLNDLGKLPQVCKSWKELVSTKNLWVNLYKYIYKEDINAENVKNAFLFKHAEVINGTESELIRAVTSFVCKLIWNKKCRLECQFPNTSYPPLIIEQSFGPLIGSSEGFKGPPDKTKRFNFVGDLPKQTSKEAIKLTSKMPWPNGIPITIAMEAPFHVNIHSGVAFFEACIQGVDVGYGNTLGFYSDINDWKEPFSLFCITSMYESLKWCGRIPYSQFKFVKIDPKGNVTWEISNNRTWSPSSLGGPYPWDLYLQIFKIQFPN